MRIAQWVEQGFVDLGAKSSSLFFHNGLRQ